MIRIGIVSKVNREEGTIEVMYEDSDDAVSASKINCLVSAGIPNVGDEVAVVYMGEASEEGLCLGKIYNKNNLPEAW